jgi:hypothetical protein
MRPGDVVAFFTSGQLFARANVAMTLDSPSLARDYWSDDTWRFVFVIDNYARIDQPLKDLRDYGLGNRVLNTITEFEHPASETILARLRS